VAELREVVYVDGVRTAFGRATPDGYFAKTRADDMAVKAVREVLRRNSQLPHERIDDVVFAATAQVGDQGLTLGRDVALLAGLPKSVPGFAVDRMCAGALTATTAGVTAAFNLNMLARINRELAGDFDLGQFRHLALYDRGQGRIEMHLVSRRDQTATVLGRQFRFRAGETIHTENSYKYDVDEFAALAAGHGFAAERTWIDPARLFSLIYLTVR